MDPDVAVGQRLAELRKQKDLRQEDFLALLEVRDIPWTQTTLSRVEGGKRALKATELFAVADALGVDAAELNPGGGSLLHQLHRLRLRYEQSKSEASAAARAAMTAGERLSALTLVHEIQGGTSSFTVRGTPEQFVELVAQALAPDDRDWRVNAGYEAVGIDAAEVERERKASLDAAWPHLDLKDGDGQDIMDSSHRADLKVFGDRLPSLRFLPAAGGAFRVEEIDVDDPPKRLATSSARLLHTPPAVPDDGR